MALSGGDQVQVVEKLHPVVGRLPYVDIRVGVAGGSGGLEQPRVTAIPDMLRLRRSGLLRS